MSEQSRLYNLEIIHSSVRGLCSECQKVLWIDCSKRFDRHCVNEDGYTQTIQCSGFERVFTSHNGD